MMARKTTKASAPPSIAPNLTPERPKARFQKLAEQATELMKDGRSSSGFSTWKQDVEVALSQYFGRPSLQLEQFGKISFSPFMIYAGMPDSSFVETRRSGLRNAAGMLTSRISEIDEEIAHSKFPHFTDQNQVARNASKIFLVHGQDHGIKETVARFLEQIGLAVIILHEQPNCGNTIIEKFEAYAEVECAVVLLTADDTAASKLTLTQSEERARQNVVFEMGFFVGKLGRTHTIALLEQGVTKPSDIDGVLYISITGGSWKLPLVRELKAAGMQVDANKAFS